MRDQLVAFSETLRESGVPVSMTEVIDASEAVSRVGEVDRGTFKVALFSTMIKDVAHKEVFDLLFDVFFANKAYHRPDDLGEPQDSSDSQGGEEAPGGGATSGDDLRNWVIRALLDDDRITLARISRAAVSRYGGMERGRAVSGVYYTYRTLKQLNIEMIYGQLGEALRGSGDDTIAEAIVRNKVEELVSELRSAVEAEVRRLLVEDRGEKAVARTMRPTLPEDVDFMAASRDELAKVKAAINPLARKLASRLAHRRKVGRHGGLDFRRTFRESLGYGGVPIELRFRPPRLAKPEIFVIADISGSVSSFSRFALQLVYALSEQFSKVRSFVFIDAIDEVTGFFDAAASIEEALRLINTEAKVVHIDGHTDYGNCLEQFVERYAPSVTKKSTVIVLGDARNNYHPSRSDILAKIQKRARHLYWLNPEPSGYWNSGDSIIGEYSKYCDGVLECRNLRQLENFVDSIG